MAAETEIERLVVRLVGDTSQYVKSNEEVVKNATQTADQIVKQSNKIEQATESDMAAAAKAVGLTVAQLKEFEKASGTAFQIRGVNLAKLVPETPADDPLRHTAAYADAVAHQQQRQGETAQFLSATEAKNQRDKISRENDYASAVSRHNEEESRFAKEAISREKERMEVAKQLATDAKRLASSKKDQEDAYASAVDRHRQNELREEREIADVQKRRQGEAQQRMAAARSYHESGFGANETHMNLANPYKEATFSLDNYHRAIEALMIVYSTKKAFEAAMMVQQEELNHQWERAAELQGKLIEVGGYQEKQRRQEADSLPMKERVEFLNKELEKMQQITAQQRQAREAADKAVLDARSPKLGKDGERSQYLPGQALESGAGYVARTFDLGGRDTTLQQAEKNAKERAEIEAKSAEKTLGLQREIAEIGPGGDRAEQALRKFKERMEEQTEAVGKGHKAITLYRLQHDNLFTDEQKNKAEEYYEAFHKTTEAYHERIRVTEEYFDLIDKGYEHALQTEREFESPLEKFSTRVQELNEDLERGLSKTAYARAIDDAKEKYDQATGAVKKFHSELRGDTTAFGSQAALLKAINQTSLLSTQVTVKDVNNPRGLNDPEVKKLLADIAANTKKNDLRGQTIQPLNAS